MAFFAFLPMKKYFHHVETKISSRLYMIFIYFYYLCAFENEKINDFLHFLLR